MLIRFFLSRDAHPICRHPLFTYMLQLSYEKRERSYRVRRLEREMHNLRMAFTAIIATPYFGLGLSKGGFRKGKGTWHL